MEVRPLRRRRRRRRRRWRWWLWWWILSHSGTRKPCLLVLTDRRAVSWRPTSNLVCVVPLITSKCKVKLWMQDRRRGVALAHAGVGFEVLTASSGTDTYTDVLVTEECCLLHQDTVLQWLGYGIYKWRVGVLLLTQAENFLFSKAFGSSSGFP